MGQRKKRGTVRGEEGSPLSNQFHVDWRFEE